MRARHHLYLPSIAAIAALLATSPAMACKYQQTPEQRIARWLTSKPAFDATVEVTITAAATLASGGWSATGHTDGVMKGDRTPRAFAFGERELVLGSCGQLFSPAQVGETWTLYLSGRAGAWIVSAYLPTDLLYRSQNMGFFRPRPGMVEFRTRPRKIRGLVPPAG